MGVVSCLIQGQHLVENNDLVLRSFGVVHGVVIRWGEPYPPWAMMNVYNGGPL